jgi:hypothetical protein
MFDPKIIAELASSLPSREADNGYPTVKLRLELAGYDTDDETTFMEAISQVRMAVREQRAVTSIIGRLTALKLTDRVLGDAMGIPRSTVQAMGCGRKAERLTKAEKQALAGFVAEHIAACQKILAELGGTL